MMSATSVTTLGIGVGDVIAEKYRIESVLGAGGMGVVFAARHTTLNGQFALKFLSREGLLSSQAIGRFYREAQAAARLRSEHAVRVFDVGTHSNGLPYIVMEYLEGSDLGRLLRASGQLPIAEAVDYMLQTCAAIADAHKAGIIHRDLKPSNLFCVTREDKSVMIKVLDFGISKVMNAQPNEEAVTVTGNFIGSPSYMSPEQMKAPNRVDSRTDIWSLGVVLYECLTAKLPFPAGTFPEICLRVAQDPPIAASAYRTDIPPRLERIIERCLDKDREKRFGSVQELAEALSEFSSGPPLRIASSFTVAPGIGQADLAPASARLPTQTASFGFPQHSWARTASAAMARRKPLVFALGFGGLGLASLVLGGFVLFKQQKLRAEVSAAVGSTSAAVMSSAATPRTSIPSVSGPATEVPETKPSSAPLVASSEPAPRANAAQALRTTGTRNPSEDVQVVPVPAPSATQAAASATPPTIPAPKKSAGTATPKALTERDSKSATWKR